MLIKLEMRKTIAFNWGTGNRQLSRLQRQNTTQTFHKFKSRAKRNSRIYRVGKGPAENFVESYFPNRVIQRVGPVKRTLFLGKESKKKSFEANRC